MDLSLANEFVVESKEHLATIEEDLLALERQGANADRALVDKLFRAMHSIKGGAGFLGLKNVNNLAHRMETLLAEVRTGTRVANQSLVEVLLGGSDRIASMLDDLEHSDDASIADLVARLDTVMGSTGTPEPTTVPTVIGTAPPAPGAPAARCAYPHPVAPDALAQRKPENSEIFCLDINLTELQQSGGPSPVALVRDLMRAGEILSGQLSMDSDLESSDGTPLRCNLLFATPIPGDVLAQMLHDNLGIPVEAIHPLDATELQLLPRHEPPPAVIPSPGTVEAARPIAQQRPAETVAPAPAPAKSGEADPASTVRINVDLLDTLMNLAGELVLVRNQQLMVAGQCEPVMRSAVQRLNSVATELQEAIMRTRMQQMGHLFSRFPRVVRDLGQKLGKRIALDVSGNEVEVDKTILESLSDPLKHLIRNSCDHGLEGPAERTAAGKADEGRITLRAWHEGGQINIEVRDDGRGIDPARIKRKVLENKLRTAGELAAMSEKDVVRLIFLPGFSTAEQVTDVSGRGVGMDVVKTAIERLGGQLDIETALGTGTAIHLRLPLTLAIIPSLIVMVGGDRYAIPQVNLEELVCLYGKEIGSRIEIARDQEVFRLRNELLPLVRLDELFQRREPFTHRTRSEITEKHRPLRAALAQQEQATLTFAVVKIGIRRFGVVLERVVGTEEIVVKPMHPAIRHLRCCSGATVMGDGGVALILDIEGIARHAGLASDGHQRMEQERHGEGMTDAHHMLLFRCGASEQFAIALPLIRRIEPIKASRIERVGDKRFITVDGVPTSILRLDQLLDVSPMEEREDLLLLLPKHTRKPCGVLVSEVIDIEQAPGDLNTSTLREDGVLGTSIMRDHLTVFPDIYRLVEKADPEERPNERGGRRMRALLAEDTAFFRQLVSRYLESGGFDVVVADDGAAALDLFEREDFDVLVSDLEMPVMDGWELMRRIRGGRRNQSIPALALTSLSSSDSIERAKRAGFDRYEVKMERGRFLATINELVDACTANRRNTP